MMLKKIIYISLAISLFLCISCERKYEELAKVTYFPDLKMTGEEVIYLPVGTEYVDSIVTATEDGVPIDVNIKVRGEMTGYVGEVVDVNIPDRYVITYSATNVDGFDGVVIRTVFVSPVPGDMDSSIEGIYKSSVAREPGYVFDDPYVDMECVFIQKISDNTYSLSHALGAYYHIGRDYGWDYAATEAVITVNDIATNDFSITQAEILGFNDGTTVDITDFIVDAANKKITFTGNGSFGNGTFNVELVQIQL